jgi:parallel beta-helix repeat protein
LNKCTLTGNSATQNGGGAYYGTVNNCTISSNSAGSYGGGAFDGTVSNCTFRGNSANRGAGTYYGTVCNSLFVGNAATYGAACDSTLDNCTLTENTGVVCGGVYNYDTYRFMFNSISYGNTGGNVGYMNGYVNYSYCCLPEVRPGYNNCIADPPQFANPAAGDYSLSYSSPCIDAGYNLNWMTNTTDLADNPRIVDGRVDMGAYEYPYTTAGIYWDWLAKYGLPIDGSVDSLDSDGDGANNVSEYRAGTNPTNAASLFQISNFEFRGSSNLLVTWQSVAGKSYRLERGTNLMGSPAFDFVVRTNILAVPPMNTETDRITVGKGPLFYRVMVE